MLNLHTDTLNKVITRAKLDAAQHPRWITAINRAARELETNPWIEAMDSHTLLIGSPSGNSYVGNSTCQCVAFEHGQPCWHRAAARLWMRYGEALNNRHISEIAAEAYERANARYPNRPLFAERDAETIRRQALAEERAALMERKAARVSYEKAVEEMNELFA